MKKIGVAVLMLLLLLTGCGKEKAEATGAELTETMPTEASAATETAGRAVYDIFREDRSLRNENGDVLVESVYEKLALQGAAPGIAAINEAISADCDRFFRESGATAYYEPETLEQMMRDMGIAYGDLIHNAYVMVTHNRDNVLSMRVSTDWFMGGVFNEDYYGMTFDLRTGEKLSLEQLSELPAEEFERQLKQIAASWLRATYGEGLFDEPERILAEFALDDLLFYVENGEIILTFPTYTFTAGAAGASVIPTGILLKKAK